VRTRWTLQINDTRDVVPSYHEWVNVSLAAWAEKRLVQTATYQVLAPDIRYGQVLLVLDLLSVLLSMRCSRTLGGKEVAQRFAHG
jgi:hypothetical protein